MRIRTDRAFEFSFLVILFFFAISLFNLAGYIFSAMVLFAFLLFAPKIRMSSTAVWLVVFSMSYFLFHTIHYGADINSIILYLIGPWSAYMLGRLYIEQSRNPNALMILLIVLSAGMYLHGVLNIVAYMRSDYFSLYNFYRQSVDFWRGELVNVKSTEMLFVFLTGIGMGVLFTSCKTRYKVISGIVVALSIAMTVFLANRTLLVIMAVILAWRLICWMIDKRVSARSKFTVVVIGLLLVLAAVMMIGFNIAGVGDYFYSLKIVERFSSDVELTRVDVWKNFLADFQFLEYSLGGKFLTESVDLSYFHNMWLDVYNVVGVVPFLILIILTVVLVVFFIRFNRAMKRAGQKNELIVCQSVLLCVSLNMLVEPIIEANPYYFLIMMMFFGGMEGHLCKLLRSDNMADIDRVEMPIETVR